MKLRACLWFCALTHAQVFGLALAVGHLNIICANTLVETFAEKLSRVGIYPQRDGKNSADVEVCSMLTTLVQRFDLNANVSIILATISFFVQWK